MPSWAATNCSRVVCRPSIAPQAPRRVLDEPRPVGRLSFYSYAGPLEHRRRAGRRRHMTRLIPDTSEFPLIWRFDIPPANNKLQWQPPTTAEYRKQKNQLPSARKLAGKLISWLKGFGFVAHAEAPAAAREDTPAVEAEPAQKTAPSDGLPEEIGLLRQAVCQTRKKIHTLDLFRLSKACQASIWDRVESGKLSVPALDHLFDPLDSATRTRMPVKVADSMTFMIRSTLIRAMGKVQERDDQSISPDLWLAVVEHICTIKHDVHVLFLFSRLMCLMPASLRAQIPSKRVAELGLVLVVAQAEQCLLSGLRLNQFAKFNEALGKLTESRRHEIHDMMRDFVLRQDDESIYQHQRLRFSWLLLRALDSQTSASDFLLAYRAVMNPGTRLDNLQLWNLSAARLLATGALPPGQAISSMPSMPMSRRWTILIRALLPSEHCDRQLRELCSFLASIDGFHTMAQAIANLPFGDMPMDGVQMNVVLTMAQVCDDHNRALDLYDAFQLQRRTKKQLAAWNWTLWVKYVEAIIKDPSINPRWVWKVLGDMTRGDDDACPVAAASDVEAKVKLLVKMSRWFLEASHLTDRQALRELTRCLSYQRKLTESFEPSTLVRLADVITRDLRRGKPGRTSRLEWLLVLTEEAGGPAEADRTAAILRTWRSVNRERIPTGQFPS
ncbi:hypothetical protein XA68_11919 [Ophiocordyceps unilateralis]|uniref:Uncharacterized protein n=1 Tax=Ophiocordyceps unilateralis TaxID=268505 RepID=A0A2A9PEX1_OPHUN|nr:hypothetical protein XA68_11919 [Ophiocordyceps unilateralis]